MKSIIAHLGTQGYTRVRIGIGEKPPRMDLADWVLGHLTGDDLSNVQQAVKEAAEAVPLIMESGVEEAMNRYNHKTKEQDK